MPRDPEPTRAKLVDSALHLFATRGLGVSLDEITRAAGQRNNASVQYHFASKSGLLREVVQRCRPGPMGRLAELLEVARDHPGDLRRLADAVVLPTTECLATPDTRAYLRIVAAIVTDPAQSDPEVVELLHDPLHDQVAATLTAWRGLEPAVARERVNLLIAMILHVCADRARLRDEQGRSPGAMSDAALTANLLDICTAALGADVTPV
jgi:AcrR family transcriptional regulator